MTPGRVVTDVEWTKPTPLPDDVSRPYWEGCARGELLIQQCTSCNHRQFYPRAMCTQCSGEVEWITCSGRGTVHTFTIVRQYGARPFRDELPYAVAMIELEEGPRMMGNVTDCPVDDVRIGMPVEAYFVLAGEGIGIPYWQPGSG